MKKLFTLLLLFTGFISYSQQIHRDGWYRKDTYEYFTITDTNYVAYKLPAVFPKTKKWLAKEKERNGEFRLDYYSQYADTFTIETALQYIDTSKDFDRVCQAKSWCIDHYQIAFPYLVARLSLKKKVGLENMADLIIWERIGTGDLPFYGHGGIIEEDIFTIAGRASWILNDLTGENFAVVHGRFTKEEAKKYKTLWIQYIHNR